MNPITLFCKEKPVLIECNPSLRAKRLSLRFSARKNGFVLTFPQRTREAIILDFLNHCRGWIEKNLDRFPSETSRESETELTLWGKSFTCLIDPLRRKPVLCIDTGTLRMPPQCSDKDLQDVFKKKAKEHLEPCVQELASRIGQPLKKVSFRDTHSRWGSCSSQKSISLSWRLVLAPPEVAYYVCAHEVAHLVHMNHSRAFWKLVESLCPSYKTHRNWLKVHGPALLRKFGEGV